MNKKDQVLNKKNKEKKYTALLVVFLLSSIILVAGIIFIVYQIEKQVRQLEREREKAFSLKEEIKSVINFEKRLLFFSEHLQRLDRMFIDTSNPLDFVEFLEKTAQEGNLEIGLSPFYEEGEEGISVRVSLRGDFNQIIKFIHKIETAPYFISIGNVVLKEEKISEKKTDRRIEADLVLKGLKK